jgi:AcrR family transcriptional regulator
MPPRPVVNSSRERILDAAARVMREKGLASTTTKLIAAAAGYSEAMIYKHFADKQQLFLAVLEERTPPVRIDMASAGHGDLTQNLTELVEQLMSFFAHTFPIAASVFGAPELLTQHRLGVTTHGRGPLVPVLAVRSYLDAEQAKGRIAADADTAAAARLLVGTAFHQGFLAAFAGRDDVPDAQTTATGIAAVIASAVRP